MDAAGKTVETQGRRTTRPSARKARNNKVYTTKGLRDRRVRLSADTAIQFYDVQDRLGYERATEALDWLIQKAKSSIDDLFGSQHYEHLTHLGVQNVVQGDFLAQSMADKGEFGEAVYLQNFQNFAENSISMSEHNFMENSMLFPHNHMVNATPEFCYTMSHKNYKIEDAYFSTPASCSMLQHGDGHSCDQQIVEKCPVSTMILFNSKLSSPSEENCSSYHTKCDLKSTSDECFATAHQPLSGLSTGPFSAQIQAYQEQLVGFNYPSTVAAFPPWMSNI